jgi:hypothetical protein
MPKPKPSPNPEQQSFLAKLDDLRTEFATLCCTPYSLDEFKSAAADASIYRRIAGMFESMTACIEVILPVLNHDSGIDRIEINASLDRHLAARGENKEEGNKKKNTVPVDNVARNVMATAMNSRRVFKQPPGGKTW